jgi:hypothetical protein
MRLSNSETDLEFSKFIIDSSQPSKYGLRVDKYLCKILQGNEPDVWSFINHITIEQFINCIKKYVITHRHGEPFSMNTLKLLMYRVKYHNPNFNPKSYKITRDIGRPTQSIGQITGQDDTIRRFISDILYYMESMLQSISDLTPENSYIYITEQNQWKMLDKNMAVFHTIVSTWRSGELKQLTINNLIEMLNDMAISVKLKKRTNCNYVVSNKNILQRYVPLQLLLVYHYYIGGVNNDTFSLFDPNIKHFHLIKSSITTINNFISQKNKRLGIQAIRSTMISEMLKYMSIDDVKHIVRHKDTVTTDLYNDQREAKNKINALFSSIAN